MIKRALNQFGLHRFINKPAYLLQNYFLCIDLIWNITAKDCSRITFHPSLYPNSHHQIVFEYIGTGIQFNYK